jgi:glucokinase
MSVDGRLAIGVDVGGTGVRARAFRLAADEPPGRSRGRTFPVDAAAAPLRRVLEDRGVEAVVEAIAAAVEEAVRATAGAPAGDSAPGASPVRGSPASSASTAGTSMAGSLAVVGVGMPGFIHEGVVLASPNFPAFRGVPLAERLHDRLGCPVHVENDANAATWGAYVERGAREDLVLLTLGTGVGGGVVTGGRLLRGSRGTGAELGHLYTGGDAPCGCGGRGCLETFASTVGLTRLARERGLDCADGRAVLGAAEAGSAPAADALAEAACALGRGLVTLVNIFNPDTIILAGGLVAARRLLAPPAEAWLRAHGIPPNVDAARLVWAERADDLAIAGAAALASEPRDPSGR